MTCPKCAHAEPQRFGTYGAKKIQRYRCRDCGATFSTPQSKPLGRHLTDQETTARIVALLMEGVSIRAAARMTNVHKNTILRLILKIGAKCERLFDGRVRNVRPRFVQADELWTFVHKKQKRLKADDPLVYGDAYLWLALDAETKAILSFHVGKRDAVSAYEFIGDLNRRIADQHRCQITTDGLEGYVPAIEEYFGADVDFAQLIKLYSTPNTSGPDWFRPSKVLGVRPEVVIGHPNFDHISTSYVERLNLNVRMHLRRFTRLTNAFSKSLEHLKAAVALFVVWYDFCRVHQTLRVTPAMEAGLTDHIWTVAELLTVSF